MLPVDNRRDCDEQDHDHVLRHSRVLRRCHSRQRHAQPGPAQGTSNAMHAMAKMPATLAQLQNEIQSVANNFDAAQAQTLRNQTIVQSGVSAQRFPDSVGG